MELTARPRRATDGPLRGGTANHGRVIRVGDTVVRPRGEHTPTVHALFDHLAARGFTGAPTALGTDGNTEIVSYLHGTAATEPVQPWALTDRALISVARLLRAYHEAAAGFDVAGRRWQREIPAPWDGPLVTHNDLNPANVIFRRGEAVGFIDFDLAAPGQAAFDLAVTACFWVPLRAAADIDDSRRGRVFQRFGLLLDAYGADAATHRAVALAAGAANHWIADIIRDNAARGHPAFGHRWEQTRGVHHRASDWLHRHADDLLASHR